MSEQCIDIRLTMLSDWHVGTGAGRPGSVDRLVARDDDGLPHVPAKTLTGVWRDACERVAAGLDGGGAGGWTAWVDLIFGDQPALSGDAGQPVDLARPRAAALHVRAARMPVTLAAHLRPPAAAGTAADRDRRLLRESLTFVKPGVKIDERTGRAEDRHLRFIEMSRVNAVLAAHAALALPEASREPALALLVAGALVVERLGGKRRRGAGRCRLELGGKGVPCPEAAVAWLADHAPPPIPSAEEAAPPADQPAADAGNGWVTVPYELRLDAPAVVAARTVGNVVETLDHVPGTLLLPHVTKALRSLGIDVRANVAQGDLRVLPATIRVGADAGRPVPLAFHRPKDAGPGDVDAVNPLVSDAGAPLKQVRQGWVGRRSSAGAALATVRTVARTHNVIDDEPQRPTERVGGVYTYVAIAPAVFAGGLVVRETLWQRIAADARWRAALSGPCRVGRSKKDDYGAATFTVAGEPQPPARPAAVGPRLVAWLLSDVIVRDERLRPDPSVEGIRRAILAALDPDGSRGIRLAAGSGPRSAFARVRRTESWQQAWGLPRPSLVGLQAGSCIAFDVEGPLTPDDLARVEAAGIGERTAEGYGQVAFNDPLVLEPATRLKTALGEAAPARALSPIDAADPAHDFARTIEEQAWREQLRRAALAAGDRFKELFGWTLSKPTTSQLGGLRSALAGVGDEAGARRAILWLDHLAGNERRRDSWPGGKQGILRVREVLADHALVWRHLGQAADDPDGWPTLTADGGERLRRLLWPTAVRSLLQAAIRACKRARDTRKRDPRPKATRGG